MIEPWFLLLMLGADREPVVLKTSPEGCAAFVADVATGYRPQVWMNGGPVLVQHSMCGPASSLRAIWQTTSRLYAPCRTGTAGICAPVNIAPVRKPQPQPISKPKGTAHADDKRGNERAGTDDQR